jgi:ferrochelatase
MTNIRRVGVLVTNLGTPDAPTAPALRRYLGEFLADPRVVEAPRLVWRAVLHGVILRTRPRRSAAAYAKIWTDTGSPLLDISRRQAEAVRERLASLCGRDIPVALGMRYGNPPLGEALDSLCARGCERVLVLPLYPQYSASTTASTFDAVGSWVRRRRDVPALRMVRDYHDATAYVDALAASVNEHWQRHGRGEKLLMSFHGIPKKYALRGDPYPAQCGRTATALARRLGLGRGEWKVCFQSRFGPQQWLRPYTDATLQSLAKDGVRRVDLLCPGFAADCLETLEENAMVNRGLFLDAGGEELSYIPCLNDRPDHIDALAGLIRRELGGWLPESPAG